jgi:ABC-type branched-subunit amino acid transport system ATPase component
MRQRLQARQVGQFDQSSAAGDQLLGAQLLHYAVEMRHAQPQHVGHDLLRERQIEAWCDRDRPSHRRLSARPTAIARAGIQLVPEDRRIFGSLSVEENLVLAGLTAENRWPLERIYDIFPRLKERQGSRGTDLSGGEQQMLAIARALRDPKLILLDEPFEGLAPVIVRDLVRACRDLADAGQTIVLVEQNLAAALTLAQRAYIINNGHIAHEGPAGEIKARPEILQRYLGV